MIPTYWQWLKAGSGGKRGVFRLLNRWLVLHIGLGTAMSILIDKPIQDAAETILLPFAAVLVGLCFAWGGNATALLQTKEISDVSNHLPGGIIEYVYTYATAILVVLSTSCLWALTGLGAFNAFLETSGILPRFAFSIALYGLSSLAVRECWHVVISVQMLLIMRNQVGNKDSK